MSDTCSLLDVQLTALRRQARKIDVDHLTLMRVVLGLLIRIMRIRAEGVRAEEPLLLFHVRIRRLRDWGRLFLVIVIHVGRIIATGKTMLVQIRPQLVLCHSLGPIILVLLIHLAWSVRQPVHSSRVDSLVRLLSSSAPRRSIGLVAPVIEVNLLLGHRLMISVVSLGNHVAHTC